MDDQSNIMHTLRSEVGQGAAGGVDGNAKCQNPILPRKRGHEDGYTEFRSTGDDPPTSTLRPSDEGTGDQYRVVPQPSTAGERHPLEQPQQTQEACCLVDEDDVTRDDSPSDPEERTVKPVDGFLVDAHSYESVALDNKQAGEGVGALHMAQPAGPSQQQRGGAGPNRHINKRKSSPQHSQGGSGATVTSGDGLGAGGAAQKKRRVSKEARLLSTEAAAQDPGGHLIGAQDTSGDGTRRGSGGSGGGSNDDVEMQGKEDPEPGNADERREARNPEEASDGGQEAAARERGGSRGSESGQVGTGHPPSLSLPISGKHPSAQMLLNQQNNKNNNKNKEESARAQSAPPGQNVVETKRRKKAGQQPVGGAPKGASLQAPWLPSLPLEQLPGVGGDGNTNTNNNNNDTLHKSRQSLQTMESFYSQAQQRFLCQAQDIMQAAIAATQAGAPGPAPDLQAITRACATAVGIINSFAVTSAVAPVSTPQAPPAPPHQQPPPSLPAAVPAGVWPPATNPMLYGGINGPGPMPLPFPLSLPMQLGMGMGFNVPRPKLQATLGGPGAVDALRMQGGGIVPLHQVLPPMVPVEMLQFPDRVPPNAKNLLQVPPLHSGKIV